MSLVNADELRDYMSGINLDADQKGAAQMILDGLQRDLERHIKRPFERKERVETVWPDEYGRVFPKASPLISVSDPAGLIIEAGGYIDAGSYAAYAFSGFLQVGVPVTITYVGGLIDPTLDLQDPDPVKQAAAAEQEALFADVRLALLRAAAREMEPRHDDTLDVADLNARGPKPDPRVVGWTDDELKRFDTLRRRTVV